MTDEEKKAMQYFYNLRATIDESNMLFDEDIDVKCGKETIKQITTILNLIEKQSKEIEKLNDTTKIVFNEILKEIKEGDKNCKYAEKENWKQEEIWEKN